MPGLFFCSKSLYQGLKTPSAIKAPTATAPKLTINNIRRRPRHAVYLAKSKYHFAASACTTTPRRDNPRSTGPSPTPNSPSVRAVAWLVAEARRNRSVMAR